MSPVRPPSTFTKIHLQFLKNSADIPTNSKQFVMRKSKQYLHSLLTSIDCCNESSSTAGSIAGRNGSNWSSLVAGPPAAAVTNEHVVGWQTPSVVFDAIFTYQKSNTHKQKHSNTTAE